MKGLSRHRIWLVTALVCLFIVAGMTIVVVMPRTVPYSQCSEVYKKYHDVSNIKAVYVKDYRLNDSVTVNATLLEAKDSAAWDRLVRDFSITDKVMGISKNEWNHLGFFFAPQERYNLHKDRDLMNSVFIVVLYGEKKIAIFGVSSKSQLEQIIEIQFRYIKNK